MKSNRLAPALVLSLLLACFALFTPSSYAQDERDQAKPAQQDESKPAQDDKRPEATKPAQDETKRPQKQTEHDQTKPDQARDENRASQSNDSAKGAKSEDNMGRPVDNMGKPNDNKMQNGEAQPPNQATHAQATDNRAGARIPDEKFRSNFGRQHTFVIQRPTTVEGQPRFQYGGYWFTLSDAWPTDWAYTDQLYIDYIDGEYFLFDLAHPGIRIAIIVVS